ncbi:MAG: long-chain fatty acid--CoA ligase [Polyangia bacterium]
MHSPTHGTTPSRDAASEANANPPPLLGLMMDYPLTLTHVLERAARLFPRKEIASKGEHEIFRYTYRDFYERVHRLAHVLKQLGVRPGDRVGTLCWNSHRHLELYFAVPCVGAVLHTLNLRLSSDQLAYIINHAEDQVIFVDASLLELLRPIRDQLVTKRFVVLEDVSKDEGDTDGEAAAALLHEAGAGGRGPQRYEELLAAAPAAPYEWPRLDENTACATCYTSGTTGHPKGVLYSHRAVTLHSFSLATVDSFGICEADTVLQLVPMFHANGWGLPFAAIMTGARLVLSGRHLHPEDIAALIRSERPTFTAGVPTLWMTLLPLLEKGACDPRCLRTIACAGSALPRRLVEEYEQRYGLRFTLAWGMTETTPIATVTKLKSHMGELPERERFDTLSRHGTPVAGVDVRIVDDQGAELVWDGRAMGELQVRGPWVTGGYFNDPRGPERGQRESFAAGWFRTGDVATIDAEGYIQIMDRTKDLVKSGGEWISSVDLENVIMAHPKVLEAAVIALPHPKWQERPLAAVVPRPEHRGSLSKKDILDFLKDRVARWWLPDDVVFIDAVPKTSVGKFNKRALRQQFEDYKLPGT